MEKFDPKFFEILKKEILDKFFAETDKFSGRIASMMKDISLEVTKNAYASGNLAGSLSHDVKKLAWGYLIKVFVNVPYADYVHEGTRPHYPPLKPLIQWVRKKGLTKKTTLNNSSRLPGRFNKNEEEDIAARIAYKISRKGTKGIKFFEIALKQALPKIEAELQKL